LSGRARRLALGVLSAVVGALVLPIPTGAQPMPTPATGSPAVGGASRIWGILDGVEIEGVVQGPATEVTPLQVACVFEYTEGDIFNAPPALPRALNGMVHLDEALHGAITDLRKSGRFVGRRFETLLITPPAGAIAAQRLLLIGLGDRNAFTPDAMVGVGSVAMREALRLNVTRYAFASDLKDAGIDSPTALIAGNVVRGSFDALRAQADLAKRGLASHPTMTRISLLAGPAFFDTAGQGIQEAIAALRK
jgi:Cytosol aminopeptidase family, N-terminal domain